MAELVVPLPIAKAIVKAGMKFVTVLQNVKTNKKDGQKMVELIQLVQTVCADVNNLSPQEQGRMAKDPKMDLAMKSLHRALEKAVDEVNRYLRSNKVIQAVRVETMAKDLRNLRQEVLTRMTVLVVGTTSDTNSVVHDNNSVLVDIRDLLLARVPSSSEPGRTGVTNETTTPGVDKQLVVVILTTDDLHARQMEDMVVVSRELSMPLGAAALLLRHHNWTRQRVQQDWKDDEGRKKSRKAVGLLPSSVDSAVFSSSRPGPGPGQGVCQICFDDADRSPAGKLDGMTSAGCDHYYCNKCWRNYISAAVANRGAQCLSLRCPAETCETAVLRELIEDVADGADKARYDRFVSLSYVDDSGGRIKWCPGRGCGRAVELLLGGGNSNATAASTTTVVCDCRHAFCWGCGEEPHRPASCSTACLWLDTIGRRSDWVLMFTKRCPMCRRRIDNDRSSNEVTCSAPCGHRFCWVCLQPLRGSDHTAGCAQYKTMAEKLLHYSSAGSSSTQAFQSMPSAKEKQKLLMTRKELENRQATASEHYKLWEAGMRPLQEALEEMHGLERSGGLRAMAIQMGLGDGEEAEAELRFVTKAYREMAECLRVMRWVHPYAYYYLQAEADGDKCKRFQDLLDNANDSLERLRACAEIERLKLYGVEVEAITEEYIAFKDKVMVCTRETRRNVEKLVTAVETDFN